MTIGQRSASTYEALFGIRHFQAAQSASAACDRLAGVWLPGRFGNSNVISWERPLDLRVVLAASGVDIYSIDYRTHFVDCQSSDPRQCSGWDTELFLSDIDRAIGVVNSACAGRPLVLFGHSFGVKLAYLYAIQPERWPLAGIVALDGWLRHPPGLRSAERRSVLEVALANGWPSGRRLRNSTATVSTSGRSDSKSSKCWTGMRHRIDTKSTRSRGTCVKR